MQNHLHAIDPGPSESCILRYDIDANRVHSWGLFQNEGLLQILRSEPSYGIVAIEMIASYGMSVGKEVFETCYMIGRLMEVLRLSSSIRRVYRQDVKLALCGSVRAKDSNIRQSLIDRLGPPGTKKAPGPTYGVSGHAWAALAVAWYAAQKKEMELAL